MAKNSDAGTFSLDLPTRRQIVQTLKRYSDNETVLRSQILLLDTLSISKGQGVELRDQGLLRLLSRALYVGRNIQLLRTETVLLVQRTFTRADVSLMIDCLARRKQGQ